MEKHTPGKWVVEGSHIIARDQNGDATANENNSVAKCYGPDSQVNARLIASAPELLDACIRAFDQTDRVARPNDWEMLRAAIAKATLPSRVNYETADPNENAPSY